MSSGIEAREPGVRAASEALRARREWAEYRAFKLGVDAVAMPPMADFLAGRDKVGCCCCLCWWYKEEEERVAADEAMVGNFFTSWPFRPDQVLQPLP